MLTRLWIVFALLCMPLAIHSEEVATSTVRIATVPLLEDNFAYILRWDNNAIVIDPSEDQRVWDYLVQEGLNLKYILNTHHHWDHVAGNQKLQSWSGCEVIGPNDSRIPCLTRAVEGGQELSLDGIAVQVIFVPGHTSTHIAFYFPQQRAVFVGDLLFGAGCGRIFEGTVTDMVNSFEKIKALPDNTQVFWGHEYTLNNLRFASAIEPKNNAITRRGTKVQQLLAQGIPSVPSILAEEKATNPFLRLDDELFKRELGMVNATPENVFDRIILLKQRASPPPQSNSVARAKGAKSRQLQKAN